MRGRIERILLAWGSRDILLYLTIAFAVYFLSEKAGLFGLRPVSTWDIIHSFPARVLGLFIAGHAAASIGTILSRRGSVVLGPLLFSLALVIIVAGLWTSYLTRFEGKAVKAEGESFTAFRTEYEERSLLVRRWAGKPAVGLTVLAIRPHADSSGTHLKSVDAEVLYSGKTTTKVLRGTLSSSWPLYIDHTLISITDFGYAPVYDLKDIDRNRLEKKGVYMKLYPPGAEDRFEAVFLGYLFYLRLYPDHVEVEGKPSTRSLELNDPVYSLRITRNKDIVYNDLIKPTGKLRFDNFIVQIPDVKMWVEIRLVRDHGLPVIVIGLLLLIVSVLFMRARGR